MKKKIIGIFVCTLLIATMIPMTEAVKYNEIKAPNNVVNKDCSNSYYQMYDRKFVSNLKSNDLVDIIKTNNYENGDELDQYQTYDCGYGWGCWNTAMLAQSFKPSLEILTRVELRLWKRGSPVSLKISIRSDLNDSDLAFIDVPASEIAPVANWFEFDFSDIDVTPGQTYYIVWDPEAFDIDNTFYWNFGDNNPYDKGCAWVFDFDVWSILHTPEFPDIDFCFATYGKNYNSAPLKPNINGPATGKAGQSYPYTFTSTDPNGDDVSYYIEWGDGDTTNWTAFQASGPPGYSESHTWTAQGAYIVKVKAKDTYGAESDWATLEVTMPKNKVFNFNFNMLEWLFERFPNAFPILRYILGLQ